MKTGGEQIAEVLREQGVPFLFTLCGGHISPILVASKALGIRVIDVRHEANAVFAADAVSRLTGVPGVAAVTAGPGVTNTITAIKNAQLAQSPLVILGGATATMLKGRGSLQDIDQLAVVRSCVKWTHSVKRVRGLAPALRHAFQEAQAGVPGPVFLECPIDLLYPEAVIREWYGKTAGEGKTKSWPQRLLQLYLRRHLARIFSTAPVSPPRTSGRFSRSPLGPSETEVSRAAGLLAQAERPVLLIGSQALLPAQEASQVAQAVEKLGVPTYLAGMSRGLLGRKHPLHMRHKRRAALKEADLVLLAGVPCDFRLGYGRAIGSKASVISANLSREQLAKNRKPTLGIHCRPGAFLQALSQSTPGDRWHTWRETLATRDAEREAEIETLAAEPAPPLNPLEVCRTIERVMGDNSVIVADGGDFVATAAYTLRPRGPLSWLDPGVFGTLGVGAGFALAAGLCRPDAEVWLIYGDGAAGFSLIEFDTFARHGIPVIAVVGNDAGWTQIARDQIVMLEDDVGTVLARTDYERAVEALGGVGFKADDPAQLEQVLRDAQAAAREGKPVLVNAHIGRSEFRKGSISM